MDNIMPEIPVELKRRQIQAEMDAIHLGEKASQGQNLASKYLATLGEWMVTRGEKLRRQHTIAQAGSMDWINKAA